MKRYDGFAIALAWPQTYCKQPGAWYDKINGWLGTNKNNYYLVGHAALILVNSDTKTAHYFDFGRYHAPYKHGRVRSAITDDDLRMDVTACISKSGDELVNYNQILDTVQSNPACHGEGELHASYTKIDFAKTWTKVINLQKNSPLPYGPFTLGGSNCSRFVQTAILCGKPVLKEWLKLKLLIPLTPTPISNVNALGNKKVLPYKLQKSLFEPLRPLSLKEQRGTLKSPKRNNRVPDYAQWLSGEGAGSWFSFKKKGSLLKVTRYSPEGEVECSGFYKGEGIKDYSVLEQFQITYPSNCWEVSLEKQGAALRLQRVASA